MILVSFDEYSCPASEDMCRVRLFEKTPPGREPIGFTGLYPFPSLSDARSFGQDWRSVPEYAKAIPGLADVRGRYQFNFHRGGSAENWENQPFDPNKGIPPESLWGKLYQRKARFLSDLLETEKRKASWPEAPVSTQRKMVAILEIELPNNGMQRTALRAAADAER